MTDFTNWHLLGTFAGTVAAVNIIVQFSKELFDRLFPAVPTRIWVYIISLLILLLTEMAGATLDLPSAGLAVINAFAVTLAAMGSYDLFIDPVRSKPSRKM